MTRTHVLVLVRRTNNDLLISDLGPEELRSGSITYIHLDYDSCQVHSQLASGTTVDRTVKYWSSLLISKVCLRGIYLRFYALFHNMSRKQENLPYEKALNGR